jgi:hypothetical protein
MERELGVEISHKTIEEAIIDIIDNKAGLSRNEFPSESPRQRFEKRWNAWNVLAGDKPGYRLEDGSSIPMSIEDMKDLGSLRAFLRRVQRLESNGEESDDPVSIEIEERSDDEVSVFW